VIVDEFNYSHEGDDGHWNLVEHVFENFSSDVRSVKVTQSGVDKNFWAGNYGSKMCGTSIRLNWD